MTQKETPSNNPGRFYKDASAAAVDGGFGVFLDDKPVRTPLGDGLLLPVHSLARAIVAEWQAQGEAIDPSSMPLCGYANTAIDRVGKDRKTVLDTLLKYAETDLLCYRADQPDDLVKKQNDDWQPLLDWAHQALGAALQVTVGVLPIEQSPEAMTALGNAVADLDDMELSAVASIAAACGSLVLALALSGGRIDALQAFQLSQLDEDFQSQRWGIDSEAKALQEKTRENIASAALFLSLLRQ